MPQRKKRKTNLPSDYRGPILRPYTDSGKRRENLVDWDQNDENDDETKGNDDYRSLDKIFR